MARRVTPKSQRDVLNWLKGGSEGKLFVGGVPGLFIRRTESGIYWIVRIGIQEVNVGTFDAFTLDQARTKAHEYRAMVNEGINPIEHKKTLKVKANRPQGLTLKNAIDNYVQARTHWAEGTLRKYNLLMSVFDDICGYPLFMLTADDILKPIKEAIKAGRNYGHVSRGRIVLVLISVRRQIPAGLIDDVKHEDLGPIPKSKPVAADTNEESLGELLWKIDELPTHQYRNAHIIRRCLQLMPYVPVRSGELSGLRWEWIDWSTDHRCINFPADVMKTRVPFTLPLCPESRRMLIAWHIEAREPKEGYVFPGRLGGHINRRTLRDYLRETLKSGTTSHGFRAVFNTLSRRHRLAPPVILQACLSHVTKGKVEGVYDRSDLFEEKLEAMDAWGELLGKIKNRVGKKLNKKPTNEYVIDSSALNDDNPKVNESIDWNSDYY